MLTWANSSVADSVVSGKGNVMLPGQRGSRRLGAEHDSAGEAVGWRSVLAQLR